MRVRRGLYATVLRGVSPAKAAVDPYLIATKLANDAVIAYHAALQFQGKAYSVSQRYTYLSCRRRRPFRFHHAEFVPVQLPTPLRRPKVTGSAATTIHQQVEFEQNPMNRMHVPPILTKVHRH